MDASLIVEPTCLHFDVSPDRKFSHASISLRSDWQRVVAFKIRVSVRSIFVVTCGEGYLEPSEALTIPVKLRNSEVIAQGAPVAKFALEFAEVLENEVGESAKSFWSSGKHASVLRRTVFCDVNMPPHLGASSSSQPKPSPATVPPTAVSSQRPTLSRALTAMMSIEELPETSLPQGRILDLMVKNVSKDTPLEPQEVEELKAERACLTKEQWSEWLQYARDEKQRRALLPPANHSNTAKASAPMTTAETARRQSLAVIQSSLQSVWDKLDVKEANSSNGDGILQVTSAMKHRHSVTFRDVKSEAAPAPQQSPERQVIIPENDIAPSKSHAVPYVQEPPSTTTVSTSSASTISTWNKPPAADIIPHSHAADIARTSTLRIDSAYSAAQCLRSALEADLRSSSNKDAGATLAILSALITSLEKSKESLNELSQPLSPQASPPVSMPATPQPRHADSYKHLISHEEQGQHQPQSQHATWPSPSTAIPSLYNASHSTASYRTVTPMTLTKSQLPYDERYDAPAYSTYGSLDMSLDFTASRRDFAPLQTTTHPATAAVIAKSLHNVRSAKGYPRIYRLGISQGVLAKTFEECPLRVDIENATVDIVWREGRLHSDTRNSVLRRERFSFDDIFAGPQAYTKMSALVRKRTKQSLATGRGVGYICVAAGEAPTSTLEPPVVTILGDRGGQGVISAVVDEIFKLRNGIAKPSTPHRFYKGPHAASSAVTIETVAETIAFSAAVISDGIIVDLLGSNFTRKNSCTINRKADGRHTISNLTRLLLKSTSDFERVAGVLLGRRSAMREVTPLLHSADVCDVPWLAVNHQENCLLFTVTTSADGVSSQGDISFHFVCPCGDLWAAPGTEVCLVSEALACLPHAPPHSLLHAGIVPRILVDPVAPEMDYITIAAVNISRDNRQHEDEMVQNALHSLRTISQVGGQS